MKKIKINDTNQIRIEHFKNEDGKRFVSLRKFWKKKDSDEWMPTKQGITLPEDIVLKVRKGIREMFEDLDNAVELEPREGKKSKSKKSKKDED